MTNSEIWNIIQKPYLGSREIKGIAEVGINRANEIRKEIAQECKDYMLPRFKVPTNKVLEKLQLDRKEIFNNAKLEIELKGSLSDTI